MTRNRVEDKYAKSAHSHFYDIVSELLKSLAKFNKSAIKDTALPCYTTDKKRKENAAKMKMESRRCSYVYHCGVFLNMVSTGYMFSNAV